MPLSWNEIRARALAFSREWNGASSERAEKQTFWNEFFDVFGIRRRQVALFEEPVRKLAGNFGSIDLFWRSVLLVEHKSRGQSLDKAHSQAFDYMDALVAAGRSDELPRYVITSDFERIVLHDLEPDDQPDLPLFRGHRVETAEIPVADLHRHVHRLAFIPGYRQHRFADQDPINVRAVEILGDLHDALKDGGYAGHDLERFLVRVLFCLFAEDTGIFERDAFTQYVETCTATDGSDLGVRLARLFDVLDTQEGKRQRGLDETLASFPYVNGSLFGEQLRFADFDRPMREALVRCTNFDWSRISPAIFGALFQSVMEGPERRAAGAHYTGERDILKVIRPLFLDALRAEFDAIRADRSSRRGARLREFHDRLAALHLFDPACGCGNFLVISYREIRALEIEVLKEIHPPNRAGERYSELDAAALSRIDVDQFYGIEIDEWPARIAEVALWLMDHQMNLRLSEAFGQQVLRLPLRRSPQIRVGNALRIDWAEVLSPDRCSYLMGNPPFVGTRYMTDSQRADMALVGDGLKDAGLLDYVTGWYLKAAAYMAGTRIVAGLVSTNSITQGEQVSALWRPMFDRHGARLHFAHRTFAWQSEARGKAHVHVVIIGFGLFDREGHKEIYEQDPETGEVTVSRVASISPYLIEGDDTTVANRPRPLCHVPEIGIGNKPIDGGNYLFTPKEKAQFLDREPGAAHFFRRWIGSEEFINGIERWCLWLGDCPPAALRAMPLCMERVRAVADLRRASRSAPTRRIAETPTRFHVENMPDGPYLVIPEVSSEKRPYIPIGFVGPEVMASNLVKVMPAATLWHFGVLSSTMHMAWVKTVCGRMKSDPRYSAKLVYNNFPWPQDVAPERREAVEAAAAAVLKERGLHPASTLADLYDPASMPAGLARAHRALDQAVDRCYRSKPFESDRGRVEFLFGLYRQLNEPLMPAETGKRRAKRMSV